MELNIEEIMEILPHRYPMLLVDKITELISHGLCRRSEIRHHQRTIFSGTFPRPPHHAWRPYL